MGECQADSVDMYSQLTQEQEQNEVVVVLEVQRRRLLQDIDIPGVVI